MKDTITMKVLITMEIKITMKVFAIIYSLAKSMPINLWQYYNVSFNI